MKLPWDKKYLKISFHVIFTLAIVYALMIIIDAASYVFYNSKEIVDNISAFFNRMMSVFLPLIAAFIIAYILDPLADFFQEKYEKYASRRFFPFCKQRLNKFGMWRKFFFLNSRFFNKLGKSAVKKYKTRTAGAVISYLFIFTLLTAIIIFVLNKIGAGKNGNLFQNITDSISRTINDLEDFYSDMRITLIDIGIGDYVATFADSLVGWVSGFLAGISLDIVHVAASAGSIIAQSMISTVIAFYFLRDKAMLKSKIDELTRIFIPEKINKKIYGVLGEIHAVFSGYIRGQLTDALIMSVLLSIGLSICGVDFAIIIGVFSGIANIIPYFGAIIAFVISVLVALMSGTPMTALYAAITILVLQQIDGIFIVPRVVGQKVELSPVMVLLSLAIAGNLFGMMGMLFAVPVFAIIKIFLTRFVNRRKEQFYKKGCKP